MALKPRSEYYRIVGDGSHWGVFWIWFVVSVVCLFVLGVPPLSAQIPSIYALLAVLAFMGLE